MTPPAWAKDKDGVYRVFPAHLLTQFPDGKWGFNYVSLLKGANSRLSLASTEWKCFQQFRHLFQEHYEGRALKETKE